MSLKKKKLYRYILKKKKSYKKINIIYDGKYSIKYTCSYKKINILHFFKKFLYQVFPYFIRAINNLIKKV